MSYLKNILLGDFRRFGSNISFDLPEGPGAMIVVAPNGTGKTSLFEAIELALTGDVMRVSGQRRVLVREGSHSAQVKLAFDGGEIAACLTSDGETSHTGSVSTILGISENKNIAELLRLTHLMDQRERTWFVSRDSDKGGEQLALHPAISDGFAAQSAIQATKLAFTTEVNKAGKEKTQTGKELTEWLEFVRQRDEANLLLEKAQPVRALHELRAELLMLSNQPWAAQMSFGNGMEIESLKSDTAALFSQIDAYEARLIAGGARLGTLSSVILQYSVVENRLLEQSKVLEIIQEQNRRLVEQHALEAADEAAVNISLTERQQASELLHKRHLRLNQLAQCQEQELIAFNSLQTVQLELGLAQDKLAKLQNTYDLSQEVQTEWVRIHAFEGDLLERRRSLDTGVKAFARWQELESAKNNSEAKIELAERIHATAKELFSVSQIEKNNLELQAKALGDDLTRLSESVDSVQAAVAEIAKHLPQDSEICPVCLQQHGIAKLREQMQRALSVTNPLLAKAAEHKDTVEASLLSSIEKLDKVRRAMEVANDDLEKLTNERIIKALSEGKIPWLKFNLCKASRSFPVQV